MEARVAHSICLNLRDPTDCKNRIHMTSRSVRLVTMLFDSKNISIVDLHYHLLRLAYMKGCLQTKKFITMVDILLYVLSESLLTIDDVRQISEKFDIERDSVHEEVLSYKKVLSTISN